MDRFTPSRAPVKRVKSIQLGVWNPEEIVSTPLPARMHALLLCRAAWHMLHAPATTAMPAGYLSGICTSMLSG